MRKRCANLSIWTTCHRWEMHGVAKLVGLHDCAPAIATDSSCLCFVPLLRCLVTRAMAAPPSPKPWPGSSVCGCSRVLADAQRCVNKFPQSVTQYDISDAAPLRLILCQLLSLRTSLSDCLNSANSVQQTCLICTKKGSLLEAYSSAQNHEVSVQYPFILRDDAHA